MSMEANDTHWANTLAMNYFQVSGTVHMALSARDPGLCGASREGSTWSGRTRRNRGDKLCSQCVVEVKKAARRD
jgi:hypothetical protein